MRPRCLDLTRLVSRVGRGPATGIDRVERAYLDGFLDDRVELAALVRTAFGLVLLDRRGMVALRDRLDGHVRWGDPDRLARLSWWLACARKQAEADLRRIAMARSTRFGLTAMLRQYLPADTVYFNVGHSNLEPRILRRIKARATVAVMIHDTIPLDFPQYQRPETPDRFARKLDAALDHGDHIICTSVQTRDDILRHSGGRPCDMIVAHPGVTLPAALPASDPRGPDRPYFVTVGTIEPRKNHAFLLDLWAHLADRLPFARMPRLVIIGRRGWRNEEVFARLDASTLSADLLVEMNNLDDNAVAALIAGASGALYPSHAEGFGLPQIEAAALGVPVVCAPLPVYRETLGNAAIYRDTSDLYGWAEQIEALASRGVIAHRETGIIPPTWHDHLTHVLKAVG